GSVRAGAKGDGEPFQPGDGSLQPLLKARRGADAFVVGPTLGMIKVGVVGPAAQFPAEEDIGDIILAKERFEGGAAEGGLMPAVRAGADVGDGGDVNLPEQRQEGIGLVVGVSDGGEADGGMCD